MSNFVPVNKFQKQALVVELYEQGKTIRQIAEVVHMGFKDISDVIKKHIGEENESIDRPEKSKDAQAFKLFLDDKQPVEVAIELDMSADEVEEVYVQYWRLSKLYDLETLYHEAKYSLSLLLQLFKKIKDNKITKDEDISTLIELAKNGLPYPRDQVQDLSDHLTYLEKEKTRLNNEIQILKNSVNVNKSLITTKNRQLRRLEKSVSRTRLLLQSLQKDPKYQQVMEIIDQRLNDRKPLLLAAIIAVMETLKKNPYGLNLLNSSSVDIENYIITDNDGKSLLQFAESCYNNLFKTLAHPIQSHG